MVDELLPPAFLGDRYRLHFGGSGGMQVLKKAQKWLCEQPGKAASERFRKVSERAVLKGAELHPAVCT